tara:strand:+ start:119 stop:319 length:201 start_codon:yes stop_codon:yes gene_type:complete
MPAKLKPSSKEYIKDKSGKMTNKWFMKHYTVSGATTEELEKLYKSPSYKRKKNLIRTELEKRGVEI